MIVKGSIVTGKPTYNVVLTVSNPTKSFGELLFQAYLDCKAVDGRLILDHLSGRFVVLSCKRNTSFVLDQLNQESFELRNISDWSLDGIKCEFEFFTENEAK